MSRSATRAFVAVVLAYCITVAWSVATVRANAPPTQQQVELAQRSSNLMLATIVAALLQEFAETTPLNVEEGKHSISLIFAVSSMLSSLYPRPMATTVAPPPRR